MKRLAVIVAVLLIFAGTFMAGPYFLLSPAFLTAEMSRSVEQATGKQLSFVSVPRLTLWPEAGAVFKGVRLTNPSAEGQEPIAEIEQMHVKIKAGALIGRRAEIEEIRLINPKFNFIIDSEGRANWAMDRRGKGDAGGAEERHDKFALPPLYVEGGSLSFADQRWGESFDVRRLNLLVAVTAAEGPVEIKGSADWQNDRVSFSLFLRSPHQLAGKGSALDLNVSGTWLDFAFSGRGAISKHLELAGTVEGGSRSLRGLMRWTGLKVGDGKGLGSLRTNGALSVKGRMIEIAKAQFVIDDIRAAGDVTLDFRFAKPRLAAQVKFDHFDLNQYLMPGVAASSEGASGIERWSDAPLDFSQLQSFDAKATISADRLTYGRAIMTGASIEAAVHEGILNAKLRQVDLYGGKASAQLILNGAQKTPIAQLSFEGSALDGHGLLRDFWNFGSIEGRTNLAVALAASGRSQREMIASMRGSAGLEFTDGAIKGIDLEAMVNSVAQNILVGWMQEPRRRSSFQLLRARFAISDGIAESSDLEFIGPGLRLSGSGLADIVKGEVDFRIEPQDAETSAAMAMPLVISGSWDRPKFYPDIAGILENPKAAYEALKRLVGKAKLEAFDDAAPTGENAGGIAGETLKATGEEKPSRAVDLMKREYNTNTLELMNGFASDGPPEPASSEQ